MDFLSKLHDSINNELAPRFQLPEIPFDGSKVRFDTEKQNSKAGWVIVNPWDFKGNIQYTAIFGCFYRGVQFKVTSYDPRKVDKTFLKVERKKIVEIQESVKEETRQKNIDCRNKWAPIYENLPQNSPIHEYLLYKKIDSNYLGRIDFNGVLYIPAYNEHCFVGCQRIMANAQYDPKDRKNNKRYLKRYTYGIEKLGSLHPFGGLKAAEFVFVCEGFATAASVHMAIKGPNIAVVAVWDTSNIYDGILTARKVNPNCKIVICADKDVDVNPALNNIGEIKAKQAARKLSNCIVRTVKFQAENDSWTDFNDLHCFEGLNEVKKQLQISSDDFIDIIPLGHHEKFNYYFATHQKKIIALTADQHTKNQILMMATEKYWGDKYGWKINQDGEKVGINWTRLIEGLGKAQTKAGFFNPENVRGKGCWLEKDEIVVNLGDKIYYKGGYRPICGHNIETRYFYEAGEAIDINFGNQLNYNQCQKIVNTFKLLKYKNPNDYVYILGWLAVAQISGALDWRPHLYLTGPKGSGKSTILDWIYKMLPMSISILGSTAAGIKQDLKNDAKAVIYDETEPNSEKDRAKMAEVITLIRQCSTRTSARILRGSATGKGLSYNTNAIFCLGSIQKLSFNSADDSRFFIIEMLNVKNQSHDEFLEIDKLMNEIKGLAPLILSHSVNHFKTIRKNIEICKKYIKALKYEARVADQLSAILAGYYSFFSNDLIEVDMIDQLIEMINFKESEYIESNDEDDSEKCFNTIMQLSADNSSTSIEQYVEQVRMVTSGPQAEFIDKILAFNGVKYLHETDSLFIAVNNVHLRDKLKAKSNYEDYASLLKRHKNFTEYKTSWLNGLAKKGIFIKLER